MRASEKAMALTAFEASLVALQERREQLMMDLIKTQEAIIQLRGDIQRVHDEKD